MGIEDEADLTLFIRNLDSRVTEEILYELFIQAGPLSRTKIPKDNDGKQKTFGFAVYKQDVSVPYAMKLLDGTALFGRTIHVQFRSGSSHSNSPGNSQNISPATTPNPGQRSQALLNSPPYTPPIQRTFSSPDNLQKQVMMGNMMWQLQMQQMQQLQLNGGGFNMQQRNQPGGGEGGGGRSYSGSGSQQQNNSSYRQQQSSSSSSPPGNTGSGGHYSRRQAEEVGSGQHGHSRESYRHHDDRGGNRQHDDRGGSRQNDDRSGNRGYQDGRRRRY